MSYNILNKNVNFQGDVQGTIEDIVDTHSTQTINGLKTITHLTGTHVRVTNDAVVLGNVSASVNISASAFYSNGVLVDPSGGGISFDGSTANGLLTYKDADEASVESNLTFDGSVLDFKTTSISGSGNISGSAFYGNGVNLTGVQTALKSNAGLNYNSNELEIKFDTLGTPAGGIDGSADKILIYDNNVGALKQVSPNNIAGLFNAAVTTYGGDNSGRVIVANGTGDIQGQANLTFSANKLTITGDLSGSGFVSASVGHFVTRVEAGAISLGDATGLAGAGLTNASGQLDIQVSGALKLASDKVGITGSLAGYGITYNGGIDSISSLKLDLGSLTDAAISRTNDFIPFIDADDGEAKRESVTDFVGFIAGAGLDASSGQLSVDVSDFLANGSDNRIITSVNADSMNAEANMTFTGDFLNINGSGSIDRLGINEDPDSNNRLIISGSNTDYLLQIKQQGNGYPTLFLGGENHASYAGVFYNRGTFVNAGAISQGNLPGDNGSHTRLVVRKTSISDNTATDIVTITVPNANHAAAIRVFGLANFDGCTYSQAFSFQGTIARASGTPTDKGFSSVTTTENASITPNFSIAVGGSSNTGANSATQTFKLQFTINTSDNSSSNATIMIELINFNDSGITMAAS